MLTGTPPFARMRKTELACRVVLEDERPSKPWNSEKLGFTDDVWTTLRTCWDKKPTARPSTDAVSVCLNEAVKTWVVDVPAFMLASRAGVEQVMSLKGDQAKDFADKLDEVRSRVAQPHLSIGILTLTFVQTLDQIGISQHSGKVYMKYLQRLCGTSGVLPASFMLTEGFDHIEERPFTRGGFADVYRATYKGQPVVAKVLKTTPMDNLEKVHEVSGVVYAQSHDMLTPHFQRIVKEVVGWKWLHHENVLPFVGVTSIPLSFSMVSTWMENGDIMKFLKTTPNQNPFSLVGTSHLVFGNTDLWDSSWM